MLKFMVLYNKGSKQQNNLKKRKVKEGKLLLEP
jgi:hypothetical protein